jgi:hypothetical protein
MNWAVMTTVETLQLVRTVEAVVLMEPMPANRGPVEMAPERTVWKAEG